MADVNKYTGFIDNDDTWLGNRVGELTQNELKQLFWEITTLHKTGLLVTDGLRDLVKEFAEYYGTDDTTGFMRMMEDAVLYEMGRRYYNSTLVYVE